jgi:hypothetical protein
MSNPDGPAAPSAEPAASWSARPEGLPPLRWFDLPLTVLGLGLAAYAIPFTWTIAVLGAPLLPWWSGLVASAGLWLAVVRPLLRVRRLRRTSWRLAGPVLEEVDVPTGEVVHSTPLDDPDLRGFHVQPHKDGTASVFPLGPDGRPGATPLVESIPDAERALAAFHRARMPGVAG